MRIIFTLILLVTSYCSVAQPADSKPDLSMEKMINEIQLTPSEVPVRYRKSDEMLFNSEEPYRFYNQSTVNDTIGRVTMATYQAYQSGNEKGTIYYFAFAKDFTKEEYLKKYFWKGKVATNEHPEEFYSKGKMLVIWSFPANSEIKRISKAKVMALLK